MGRRFATNTSATSGNAEQSEQSQQTEASEEYPLASSIIPGLPTEGGFPYQRPIHPLVKPFFENCSPNEGLKKMRKYIDACTAEGKIGGKIPILPYVLHEEKFIRELHSNLHKSRIYRAAIQGRLREALEPIIAERRKGPRKYSQMRASTTIPPTEEPEFMKGIDPEMYPEIFKFFRPPRTNVSSSENPAPGQDPDLQMPSDPNAENPSVDQACILQMSSDPNAENPSVDQACILQMPSDPNAENPSADQACILQMPSVDLNAESLGFDQDPNLQMPSVDPISENLPVDLNAENLGFDQDPNLQLLSDILNAENLTVDQDPNLELFSGAPISENLPVDQDRNLQLLSADLNAENILDQASNLQMLPGAPTSGNTIFCPVSNLEIDLNAMPDYSCVQSDDLQVQLDTIPSPSDFGIPLNVAPSTLSFTPGFETSLDQELPDPSAFDQLTGLGLNPDGTLLDASVPSMGLEEDISELIPAELLPDSLYTQESSMIGQPVSENNMPNHLDTAELLPQISFDPLDTLSSLDPLGLIDDPCCAPDTFDSDLISQISLPDSLTIDADPSIDPALYSITTDDQPDIYRSLEAVVPKDKHSRHVHFDDPLSEINVADCLSEPHDLPFPETSATVDPHFLSDMASLVDGEIWSQTQNLETGTLTMQDINPMEFIGEPAPCQVSMTTPPVQSLEPEITLKDLYGLDPYPKLKQEQTSPSLCLLDGFAGLAAGLVPAALDDKRSRPLGFSSSSPEDTHVPPGDNSMDSLETNDTSYDTRATAGDGANVPQETHPRPEKRSSPDSEPQEEDMDPRARFKESLMSKTRAELEDLMEQRRESFIQAITKLSERRKERKRQQWKAWGLEPESDSDDYSESDSSEESEDEFDHIKNKDIAWLRVFENAVRNYKPPPNLSKSERIRIFEEKFQETPKLNKTQVKELAELTGVSEQSVRVWFANKRSRSK